MTPELVPDLLQFLRECQPLLCVPPPVDDRDTLPALPVEHPWTDVFGEMLDMAGESEKAIRERIGVFPECVVNGTLAVVAVQVFVDFWAELGDEWRKRDGGSARAFADRLASFLQHALGLFTFSPMTYQEFPDGWLQRVGGRPMVSGRVRRVLRPGLQDGQNQLRVPALVEVE